VQGKRQKTDQCRTKEKHCDSVMGGIGSPRIMTGQGKGSCKWKCPKRYTRKRFIWGGLLSIQQEQLRLLQQLPDDPKKNQRTDH
jgi:hypothetical protein